MRRLLVLLLLAAGLVLVGPAPTYACSCVGGDTEDFVGWSDVVFTGTVIERVAASADATGSVRYVVDVDTVMKGEVDRIESVDTGAQESACGLPSLEEDERYVFYATEDDGDLFTGLCSGTGPAGDGTAERVSALTGRSEPATLPDLRALIALVLSLW